MNIPKPAIEKAIERGWKIPGDVRMQELGRVGNVNKTTASFHVWLGSEKETVGVVSCPLSAIALDPTFWQALGKALGWGDSHSDALGRAEWRLNAWRFYDLIFSGGDTEKFWQELLANK